MEKPSSGQGLLSVGLSFVLFPLLVHAAPFDARVIYGEDDRKELYELQGTQLGKWSRSTSALFLRRNIGPSGEVLSPNLAEATNLCPGEPHQDQPTGAFCSGALIAPDLILTAGHCVEDVPCSDIRIVFDYALEGKGADPWQLSKPQIYSCRSILISEKKKDGTDFAVLKLSRPVKDRTPLPLLSKGKVDPGQRIVVAGYPWGLPLKIVRHGVVRKSGTVGFHMNADTFEGNSGSPVISPSTGEILGVLVSGETDSELHGNCRKIKRCTETGCSGETAAHISRIIPKLSPFLIPGPDTLEGGSEVALQYRN